MLSPKNCILGDKCMINASCKIKDDALHCHINNNATSNKLHISGLMFNCPVNQDNPKNCVLHEIRKLECSEKMKWFNSLSIIEMDNICDAHALCPYNIIENNR